MKHCGHFRLRQYRNRVLIAERRAKNATTNIGAQTVLNGIFRGDPLPTSWFLGIIDNAGFISFSLADTMASHAGWTEFTAYSGARKAFTADLATGRTIRNAASPALFLFTGLAVIEALFVTSDSTKGGTAGILLATSLLGDEGSGAPLSLVVGDEIEVDYQIGY